MIRPSRRSSGLLVAALAYGCAARSKGASFPTATDLPDAPRQPDGVVVEPAPQLPAPAEARSSDAPLVSLRAPLSDRLARKTVALFFRAALSENLDAIADLATPDANLPNKSGGLQPLVDFWRGRIRQLHYQALSAELLYQDSDMELYRYADLEFPIEGRPPRPAVMAASDLLVRVPMHVVQSPTERLFGPELVFLLRPDRGRYRIRQIMEDFALP